MTNAELNIAGGTFTANGSLGVKTKNSADDMVGSDLVRYVKISGFSRRLERSDDDSGGIRAQI